MLECASSPPRCGGLRSSNRQKEKTRRWPGTAHPDGSGAARDPGHRRRHRPASAHRRGRPRGRVAVTGAAAPVRQRHAGDGAPGERGGFREAGLYHDLSHILGGYDTSPEGEGEVASFSAGYKRTRPFYVVLFAVMIYSAGVNVRPTAVGNTTVGALGKPGMAERLFGAIERGSKVNTDLSDKWDYWPYVELPVDEARRRLNIVANG